jgi:K+-transporting ATPase ATPase B chain
VPGDGEVVVGAAATTKARLRVRVRRSFAQPGATSTLSRAAPGAVGLDHRAHPVNPGEAFLDRMISMVEGASRQKTPNEIALTIPARTMTLIFLLAKVTLLPYSIYSVEVTKADAGIITVLVALLVASYPPRSAACCRP